MIDEPRWKRIARRASRGTIWEPHALDHISREMRGIYWWVLPLTDLLFLRFGYVGWQNGVGSVAQTTTPAWQTTWSIVLALAALTAFAGITVRRLWYAELAGKLVLVACIFVYIGVLLVRGEANMQVQATGGLYFVFALVPLWRIGNICADLGKKLVAWKRARRGEEPGR